MFRAKILLLLLPALYCAVPDTAFARDRGPPLGQERCGDEGEVIGTIVGGIIGALVGNQVGRKRNRVPATIIGGIVGGIIGGKIGRKLDCDSKRKLAEATGRALATDQPQAWSNPDAGTSGTVMVQQPPPDVAQANPDKACRTVRQTVILADGRRETEIMTVCRKPDGSWTTVEG